MNTVNQQLHLDIETQKGELARAIVDEQWRLDPQLNSRYGASGWARCVADVKYNLSYLAQAIASDSPALFADYINWVSILFDGLKISRQDLAANLEITGAILQQRFPGEPGAIARKYIEASLPQLTIETVSPIPSFIDENHPLAGLARLYLQALLRGERHVASRLILKAVDLGVNIKDIYLQVFSPCQQEVGRLWQLNQISVAQEHYCTAATQLIMSQLYPTIFAGEKVNRRLVATCIESELHELGIRMVADFFEMEGWDTYYLGGNVPTTSIVRTLNEQKADILAISATITFHVKTVANLIQAVREATLAKPVKILVGGYPFNVEPELWRQVGADGWARSAQEAIATANALIGQEGQYGI
ncbi:MAG: cobalamin-binding protein [Anaerolineales bacterium]|nr:cobalamin-binding protein [Anaerolineales bacterium]